MPAPLGQSVRNKANSAEAAGWASTWWKRIYCELNLQKTSTKQSQFAQGPHRARAAMAAAGGARVRNKANLGRNFKCEVSRVKRFAQNEDNFGRGGASRAKRSQFAGQDCRSGIPAGYTRHRARQIKPIWGGPLYKQTQSVGELLRRTKPIGRSGSLAEHSGSLSGSGRAKQSQFAATPRGTGGCPFGLRRSLRRGTNSLPGRGWAL